MTREEYIKEFAMKQVELYGEISRVAVVELDLDDPEEFVEAIDKAATVLILEGY